MAVWWRAGPREVVLEEWAASRAVELGGRLEKLSPTEGQKYRPDRAFLHPRRPPAFLELKRRGKRPTPEQTETLARLQAAGYVAGWADSKEGVEALLARAMMPPLAMAVDIVKEAERLKKEAPDAPSSLVSARARRRAITVPANVGTPPGGRPGGAPARAP
jgi:hypothetical protein